jgi:hypothetical protein
MTWAKEDIFGIYYQAMAREDIEDLVGAAVICRVCRSMKRL